MKKYGQIPTENELLRDRLAWAESELRRIELETATVAIAQHEKIRVEEEAKRDVINGLIMAVSGALVGYFAQLFNVPGFDYATIQWGEVLRLAVTAGGMYLMKNLFSTKEGSFAGIGPKA